MDHIRSTIQNFPLFAEMPPEELSTWMARGRLEEKSDGETVFSHGERAGIFYIIVEGNLRLVRMSPEGKEHTLYLATPGDMLGAHEFLEKKALYQSDAVAETASRLLAIPMDAFRKQLLASPAFALNMLAEISRRSTRAVIEKEQMVSQKAPERVGCFLMRLCEIHGFDPADFTLPYSKSVIASRLGMEPESLSRALAQLKKQGVAMQGKQIRITDLDGLQHRVCSNCAISSDCETIGSDTGGTL